jgi:ribosomal protein L39E
MTRYIHPAKKRRLGKLGKRTKWAPFWIIPKIAGIGKKIHPSRFSAGKRHWRRTKTKA